MSAVDVRAEIAASRRLARQRFAVARELLGVAHNRFGLDRLRVVNHALDELNDVEFWRGEAKRLSAFLGGG